MSELTNIEEQVKLIDAAFAKSAKLPEGLQLNKLFRVPAADGYAVYEITGIGRSTVKIKWREDLCPDGYVDMVLDEGGTFSMKPILRIVAREDSLRKYLTRKDKKQ